MKSIKLLSKFGPNRKCKLPYPEADHCVADGTCPCCAAEPFKLGGSNMRASKDDRAWESDAGCLACRAHVGTLRVEMNTLFGVREDAAVLSGRVRIY